MFLDEIMERYVTRPVRAPPNSFHPHFYECKGPMVTDFVHLKLCGGEWYVVHTECVTDWRPSESMVSCF